MAGVVWFDGTRVNDAETATGWSADGITPAQENDFKYQGTFSVSGALKANTEAGFLYTSAAQNFSANNGTWLAKFVLTNKDAMNGNGLMLKIGSTTAAYYLYTVFSGATSPNILYNYPAVGGFQIIPINPNKTEYLRTTTGAPNLASVTIFGIRAQTLTAAKSPNVGMDAIDWFPNGKGLSLSGTSSSFDNFVTFDEGTITNRYGVVITKEGILYVTGTLTIGNNNLTTFTDSNKTIIFPYGRFDTGFCGVNFNLAHTGSTASLDAVSMVGRGFSGATDTRPDFTVGVLTGGTVSIESCSFTNFNRFFLNNKVTVNASTFNTSNYIIQSGTSFTSCSFSRFTTGSTIYSDNPGAISYCDFTSDGSNHGVQITTPGTYNFYGNVFNGYVTGGTSGTTGNEAVYNSSGGLVTIYVLDGGTNFSYRNSVGSTTNKILEPVTLSLSGLIPGTEVRIYQLSDMTELAGIESGTTGFTYSYTYTVDIPVYIQIISLSYEDITLYYTLNASSSTIPISQKIDRNYNNP